MEIQDAKVYAPAPFCVSRPNGEIIEVIRISQKMQVYSIDGASAFIWKQFDGKRSLKQILSRVTDEFDVTESRAKRDLISVVKQLLHLELLQEK